MNIYRNNYKQKRITSCSPRFLQMFYMTCTSESEKNTNLVKSSWKLFLCLHTTASGFKEPMLYILFDLDKLKVRYT